MSRPYALLSFLWAMVIFLFSTLRLKAPGFMLFPHGDKLLHFAEFALLALLIYKAFFHSAKIPIAKHAAVFSFMLALLYGAGLELYQGMLGYRDCSLADFAADFVGVVFIIVFVRYTDGQGKG